MSSLRATSSKSSAEVELTGTHETLLPLIMEQEDDAADKREARSGIRGRPVRHARRGARVDRAFRGVRAGRRSRHPSPRSRRSQGTGYGPLLRQSRVHPGGCDSHLLRPRADDRTHRVDLEVGGVREVLRLREAPGRARLRQAERGSGGVDRAVRRAQQEVRASRGRLRPLTVPNGSVRCHPRVPGRRSPVFTEKGFLLRLLLHDRLILFGGEEVGFVFGAEFDDPALTVGVLVYVLGCIFEGGVDLDDLTADRGIKVGDGLDALDGAEGFAGVECVSLLWQLDEDDIAEFVLGVIRDAYRCGVALYADPLVALCVLKVFRYVQGSPPILCRACRTAAARSSPVPGYPLSRPRTNHPLLDLRAQVLSPCPEWETWCR